MRMLVFLLLGFSTYLLRAQQYNVDSVNSIENGDASLHNMCYRLKNLDNGKAEKIRILHIGDSHVQPDNFSGEVRRQLQAVHGNGGRGIIFPYSLAKTNGPKDFTVSSDVQWTNSWNLNYPHKYNLGIAGMSIQSVSDHGSLLISLSKDSIRNPYSCAKVIYSISKEGTVIVNGKSAKMGTDNDFDTISIALNQIQTDLKIEFRGDKLTLHGVYFENGESGIVYSSVGVAGAKYRDFNRTELFFSQLQILAPEFIIISLGTNESFDPNFTEQSFASEVDTLIQRLQRVLPDVGLILTLPSENYRVKSEGPIVNPRVAIVSSILRTKALQYNCAIWDLYRSMGGKGSMLQWKKEGLVNNDHIHYLRKGYNRQGKLLFEAIESLCVE